MEEGNVGCHTACFGSAGYTVAQLQCCVQASFAPAGVPSSVSIAYHRTAHVLPVFLQALLPQSALPTLCGRPNLAAFLLQDA
jgi:hypothetical protein